MYLIVPIINRYLYLLLHRNTTCLINCSIFLHLFPGSSKILKNIFTVKYCNMLFGFKITFAEYSKAEEACLVTQTG